MKKILSAFLALLMVFSMVSVCFAETTITLKASMVTKSEGVSVGDVIRNVDRKGYFMFADVDLTGINSISTRSLGKWLGNSNGATLRVIIDNLYTGDVIGELVYNEVGESVVTTTAIRPTTGKHDLYFYSLYSKQSGNEFWVSEITLSSATYENDKLSKQVPDSMIIDNWHDTWTATDGMGRAIADYEEVGDVKTDTREVGMLYWNWHTSKAGQANGVVISDIIKAHPEAKEEYANPVWDPKGAYFWSEPLFGFYNSYEYWTYRKHAEMLADAGVDSIYFDYSNGGNDFIVTLNILAGAFRDAKATGIDIPRISAMMTLGGRAEDAFRGSMALYYNCFVDNDYSDIWAYWEGKPLMFGNAIEKYAIDDVVPENLNEVDLLKKVNRFFTLRYEGHRNGNAGKDEWVWLENFPQVLRNPDETGRPEFVSVGVGINQSTIFGLSQTGVFSDEYNKGRGYSEAFGEDYTENGKREGWFFREQAALALDAAPKFVMIDGWNEFTAVRNAVYNGFKNSFVDLYDDENSRDFEPSAGVLGDDYYMLLTDFVRKFKGVRPAPVASGAKTIDLAGGAAQWADVAPQFVNSYQDYERDADGLGNGAKGGEAWHYTTHVNNAIKGAKVSFDADKFYFMVETEKAIKTGTPNWMNLYINTDRNHATGWEGYDFSVNVAGTGVIAKSTSTAWAWENIGTAEYKVDGSMLTVAVPRALIGETDTVDLEFKWTDTVACDGNILNFYKDGSVAPYGRFNYLYTEVAQKALDEASRSAMKDSYTSLLKAGSNKMIACGGKMTVHEADTRITPYEANGTLYIPEDTFLEIMGYGHAKTRYNYIYNVFLTYHYDMNDALTEMENYTWTYSTLDSAEVHVNGRVSYLSAPVTAKDGIIYVPISLIAECYGWQVASLGNGLYTVSRDGASQSAISAAQALLG